MDAKFIQSVIENLVGYSFYNIYVKEYTHNRSGVRIDAVIIDTQHKWVRGYEIKTSRQDYFNDEKYLEYTKFCSSLCIVCPEGLIQLDEVKKPLGLMWVREDGSSTYIRKPKNFQKRNSLSWFWTYLEVLEFEFRRLSDENKRFQIEKRRNGQ